MVCLWSFFPSQFLLNLAGSVMLYISVLRVRMTLYTSLAKAKTVLLDGEFVNFKIRLQHVVWNKATDWLIGVKFTHGFKATIKCGLPLVSCARESSYLSWCIPSKFRKYQSCNRQTLNEFVKFLICFHNCLLLFLSAPVDDDFLMCKRSMRVNRFIVIAQALDQFPPFLFWPQKLHVSGTHITRMRTAYHLL